ncbi:hypothetical protein DKT75_20970 [Leucothrix arctica]|uniref:Uncharacterized protein n=1 Tax=Leucothrix arctica TaxID=1481894 RepID=A0A317C6X0_9GAMM|nr:hypothetical protein DKT75_20970 [Leucothrix arctica]
MKNDKANIIDVFYNKVHQNHINKSYIIISMVKNQTLLDIRELAISFTTDGLLDAALVYLILTRI